MRQSVSIAVLNVLILTSLPGIGWAQELDVPIVVEKTDDLDTCGLYGVAGLSSTGDNFLAVRTGPGVRYGIIDKLHTGDQVMGFDERDGWVGIVYGSDDIECSPVNKSHIYNGPGKKGWVYGKYIKLLAG